MDLLLDTIPSLLDLATEDLHSLGPSDLLRTLPDGLTRVTVDLKDIHRRLMQATGIDMKVRCKGCDKAGFEHSVWPLLSPPPESSSCACFCYNTTATGCIHMFTTPVLWFLFNLWPGL